ncbi:hypothetical protein C8F01DRAFT_1256997 [Mycena amicta]|nr:hypothetical protein C8F01DRAFT_1256997 [Mycena amicta]
MAAADDLPWPELGNVSRGATRGNQGQKGVLGPPDRDGRCVLQLRVQPGVLAVRLNSQASDWYRTLDNEARRRQDYDARADQDHMELHEWLQQLKDKTMSHLELLMQKGDIQGPPYAMPEDIELTFLRKFIERQAAGIDHNPRLRNGGAQPDSYAMRQHSVESPSPEPSERAYMDQKLSSRNSGSPAMHPVDIQEPTVAALHNSRAAFVRAQKDSQDAFIRYTNCLELERQARAALVAAEKRHDDYMAALTQSRHSSVSGDEPSPRYDDFRPTDHPMRSALPTTTKPMEGLYTTEPTSHLEARLRQSRANTHAPGSTVDCKVGIVATRDSVRDGDLKLNDRWADAHYADPQYACQDMSGLPPPRKRVHHMIPGFDVLSSAALQSNMLQS